MPNWTENTLTVILPTSQRDAFLEAVKGPHDFIYPLLALSEHEQPKIELSNHDRLKLADVHKQEAKYISSFKTAMKKHGWPEWMKPSMKDIEVFFFDPGKRTLVIEPFSVAKLAPITLKEFEKHFPDADPSSALWTPAPKAKFSTNSIIDMRTAKIGTKWPPLDISLEVYDYNENSRITIRYTTATAPLSNIADLLHDVCSRHGAKFLLTWVEEQGLCGYTYLDPASDEPLQEEDYEFEHNWFTEDKETDPENPITVFDMNAFQNDIPEIIGDPDF
jgi:hypothetical protein